MTEADHHAIYFQILDLLAEIPKAVGRKDWREKVAEIKLAQADLWEKLADDIDNSPTWARYLAHREVIQLRERAAELHPATDRN